MRSINLLPSEQPWGLPSALFGGFAVGFLYLAIAYARNGRRVWLGEPIGGMEWSFGKSFATNFTVGTGLLGLVFGGTLIADPLHYMSKTHYVVLSLMFAAILLIAPAMFTFFSAPHNFSQPDESPVVAQAGPVWFFLLMSALMVGAVLGQLFTVGLAIDEVRYRGYLNWPSFLVIAVLLGAAGVGACYCAGRVVPDYFINRPKQQRSEVAQRLSTFKRKAGLMHSYIAQSLPGHEPLLDEDMNLLDHLIAREQVPPKWTMF